MSMRKIKDLLTILLGIYLAISISSILTLLMAEDITSYYGENQIGEVNDISSRNNNMSDIWVMFHHDQGLTGFSSSIAPDTNQTFWTFKLDSGVEVPPIIIDDKVFVVSHYMPYLNGTNLYAINEKNGKILWKFLDQGGNIYTSPAYDNGTVFVAPEYHGIYALNEETGDVYWNFNGRDYEYFDYSYSPTIHNGNVFISLVAKNNLDDASNPGLYKLDGKTGDVLWEFENGRGVPAISKGKVIVMSFETDSQNGHYRINCVNEIGNDDETIIEYASTDLIWTFENFEQSPYIYPTNPSVIDEKVIFGCKDGYIYVLDINDGSLLWKYNLSKPIYQSTPAIYDNKIYIGTQTGDNDGNGDLYCINLETKSLVWKQHFLGDIESSIAVADGKAFFGTTIGNMYALSTLDGSIIWQYKIGEYGASSPAVANGKVFISSVETDLLYCFGNNNVPVLNNITANPTTIKSNEDVIISVNAIDYDDDVLTYHYQSNGGIISGIGPIVTWTAPSNEGIYTISATVDDGLITSNSMGVDIIVKANQAPVIYNVSVNSKMLTTGNKTIISVEAYDNDGDKLFYEYDVTGGIIIGNGSIVTWQAPEIEGFYQITIKVFDGELFSKPQNITLEVYKPINNTPINNPPIILEITTNSNIIGPGESTTIFVNASDPNPDDKLDYQYEADSGYFTGSGPVVKWIAPDIEGEFVISVTVMDSHGLSDVGNISIFVQRTVIPNNPPVILDIVAEPSIIAPGEYTVISVEAEDNDIEDVIEYLYYIKEGRIEGNGSKAKWFAPNKEGDYIIRVVVKDKLGLLSQDNITITVRSQDNNDKLDNDNTIFALEKNHLFIGILVFIIIIIGSIIILKKRNNKEPVKKRGTKIEVEPLNENDDH